MALTLRGFLNTVNKNWSKNLDKINHKRFFLRLSKLYFRNIFDARTLLPFTNLLRHENIRHILIAPKIELASSSRWQANYCRFSLFGDENYYILIKKHASLVSVLKPPFYMEKISVYFVRKHFSFFVSIGKSHFKLL